MLLNLNTFKQVADLLTHYCLNLVITKWSNTKIIRLAIAERKEEAVEFKLESGSACLLTCKLLLKYSLPCRH